MESNPGSPNSHTGNTDIETGLTRSQLAVLLGTVLIVAVCGIVYELIIASVSSYLLGDGVLQFSVTIGLFMFAMGIGSYLTKSIQGRLIERFVAIESALAIVGGISGPALFLVFPYPVFYKPVMYALILAIGILVGLEIPILTRIINQAGGLRRSIATVLAMDYFGALVGAVSFPLLLLPFLGLFKVSFGIGLLNAAVAMVNIVVFREHLPRPKFAISLGSASIASLLALLVFSALLATYAENQLYADPIVWKKQTSYQRIVLTKDRVTGDHRLYLDGHLQFDERDEYRYHEALVHPALSLPGPAQRVLILGGGDGLAAREILRDPRVQHIDLVDLDPAITQLCSSLPAISALNERSLTDSRLSILNRDAFTYLREPGVLYDRVIIDLPDPHNEALSKLYSVEFYKLLRSRLAPGGVFVTQSSSPWYTPKTYWSIGATIENAGFNVLSYHASIPSFGVWGFHLGTNRVISPGDISNLPEARYFEGETLQAAFEFPPDIARVEGVISSIFEPTMYLQYEREINQ